MRSRRAQIAGPLEDGRLQNGCHPQVLVARRPAGSGTERVPAEVAANLADMRTYRFPRCSGNDGWRRSPIIAVTVLFDKVTCARALAQLRFRPLPIAVSDSMTTIPVGITEVNDRFGIGYGRAMAAKRAA